MVRGGAGVVVVIVRGNGGKKPSMNFHKSCPIRMDEVDAAC